MKKIQYIGKQSNHTDRLYKTRVLWAGAGDVQEVPDDVAIKMLSNHPDCYRIPSEEPLFESKSDKKIDTNEKVGKLDDADDADDANQDNGAVVMLGNIPLSVATKDEIIDFAQKTFDITLSSKLKIAELKVAVTDLLVKQ